MQKEVSMVKAELMGEEYLTWTELEGLGRSISGKAMYWLRPNIEDIVFCGKTKVGDM